MERHKGDARAGMPVRETSPKLAAMQSIGASLDRPKVEPAAAAAVAPAPPVDAKSAATPLLTTIRRLLRRHRWLMPHMRRAGYALGAVAGIFIVGLGLLWWRLSSGPIALDLATPWITSAIESNFGSRHRVEVGGTVVERDENGRTAVRLRDIVVREPNGAVVASAPRAEVGLSGSSLLSGHPRAESLNLVGAEISVRIDPDGQFTLLTANDKNASRKTAAGVPPDAAGTSPASPSKTFLRDAPKNFNAFLAWIDSLRALGLDGYDLNEIGLKNGRVLVDDQRNGQQSVFENINLSLQRRSAGEVLFSIGSEQQDRPWLLLASVKSAAEGRRAINIEARRISLRDLLLALRVGDGQFAADVPFSATLQAELARDGTPEKAMGRMVMGPGSIGEGPGGDLRIPVDRAEVTLEWDAARRIASLPFQIVSGANRFTLLAQAEAPSTAGGPWALSLSGGTVVLGPRETSGEALLIDRVVVRGRFDPKKQRIDIDRGDIGGRGVGLAVSGNFDFSADEPRVAIGIAAQQMSVAAFKQLWPIVFNPPVRAWVLDHFDSGAIERVEIATNAPLPTLQPGGPPVPDEGLSIEIVASRAVFRPVEGLPAINDADLVTRVTGRSATIALGRGTVDLSSGRRLTVSNGIFEIPDTWSQKPPARVKLRIDGPVPAAAELLGMDRLRAASGTPLDPAVSRGTVTAQVALSLVIDPEEANGSVTYNITTDVTNFAVDRFVMAQKIEASSLRIVANNQGYQVKGDIRIAGTPASIEYRKLRDENDAQFRLQGTFDDAARARMGFDLYGAVSGAIPVKLAGRVGASGDQESRFSVEADLTQAKLDNLLPGWVKPAGKSARLAMTYVGKGGATRYEDLVLEGSGALVKGVVEMDADGEIQSANLPTFALSDGDKATLKAERTSDGLLKVTMRGDVFDGRGFVRASMAGSPPNQKSRGIADLDLDVKIGAVAGFNGEAVRALDLHAVRRGGQIRSFALNGKLGVDTPLLGDLRARNDGKQAIYFETNDAGSLFRFTDTYPRMHGGQMWVAMDPPTLEQSPQDGVLNIRDFTVRGEAALDRVVAGAPGGVPNGVEFTRLRVEFTRAPGKLALRDGVVRGPIVGATIEGMIDYANNDVRMRGTFVPLYGLNNAFGQIPIVGLFLGGEKEGLVGVTYEVVGPPGRSVLRVNPISAVAPGLLRKFFEFPNTSGERNVAPYDRQSETTR